MTIIDRLNIEHGVFLRQLAFLHGLLSKNAPDEVLAAVMQAIGAGVEPHRDDEEELLYPAITAASGGHSPPVEQMEREHKAIDKALRDAAAGKDVPAAAGAFVDLLEEHIDKEIRILFPYAERTVPKGTLSDMSGGTTSAADG